MTRSGYITIIGLTALLMSGCGGKGPQIPSQRKGEAPKDDSSALAVMEMNLRLACAADDQLRQLATAQEESYALYDAGTWIHIIDRGKESIPSPGPNDTCELHMRVYSLNGRLLLDTEGTFSRRKNEIPAGVDWNLGELHPGGKARLYVPWYMAYGLQGTDYIPPYENVIIDIELR